MDRDVGLSWVERFEPALLLSAVALGLGLARAAPGAAAVSERVLTPALMLLLGAIFYRVPLRRLRVALGHRRYFAAALALNFVLMPLVAYALGWLFLRSEPALWLGLILVLVTPCTDWYLVFTALARGDVPLNLALLPWNLLLQLALLPLYLYLFTRALVPLDFSLLTQSFLLFVLIPFAAAQLLRRFLSGAAPEQASVILQYAALTVLIVALFAQQGRVLFDRPQVVLKLLPPVALFFLLASFAALAVGRVAAFSAPSRAALACTACARNSPLTLSLALLLFPAYPLVALTQVIEPLLELPFLILLAYILRRAT
ncbi:MAG: arsenic resistance protein [Acidobacteria bacterium]|nr:arsenic resistance protein [Acidobacteriota bacterium]